MLKISDVKKYIDFALEWGTDNIVLGTSVGEPLLMPPEDLREILEYCETTTLDNVLIITSLSYINSANIDLITSPEFTKNAVLVSVYGNSKEHYLERTRKNGFDVFVKNTKKLLSLKTKAFKLSFLNRTNEDYSPELLELLGNYIDEDPAKDFDYNIGKYHKDLNYLPERKGQCLYAAPCDCGFDYENNLVLCSWLTLEMKIGNLDEGAESIRKTYDDIIKKQNMNMFSKFCANCEGYQPNE